MAQKYDKLRMSGRRGVAKYAIGPQIYVCLASVWKAGGPKIGQSTYVWKARCGKICNLTANVCMSGVCLEAGGPKIGQITYVWKAR